MRYKFKIAIGMAIISTGILVASFASAAVGKIANTKHNFQAGGPAYQNQDSTVNQVCVFCHTPHNAGKTRLLWNKASHNTAIVFKFYTSSPTLSSVAKAASLTANSPSLFCLSCHDGKTAMNVLHSSGTGASAAGDGYPAGTKYVSGNLPKFMAGPVTDMFENTLNPNLGRTDADPTAGYNLTDDHPIGFSYSDVMAIPLSAARLHTITQVATNSSNSIKFFGNKNMVECTSCHDPHIDYSPAGDVNLKPFLVMSNSGSALCRSCHNK